MSYRFVLNRFLQLSLGLVAVSCCYLSWAQSYTPTSQWSKLENSAGIDFFKGSWREAQAYAQEMNKMIFVDIYGDQCPPCERMEDIFRRTDIAQIHNRYFVNFKMNGRLPDEDYQLFRALISSELLPTFAYLNAEAVAIEVKVGEMSEEEMLHIAKCVLRNDLCGQKPWVERSTEEIATGGSGYTSQKKTDDSWRDIPYKDQQSPKCDDKNSAPRFEPVSRTSDGQQQQQDTGMRNYSPGDVELSAVNAIPSLRDKNISPDNPLPDQLNTTNNEVQSNDAKTAYHPTDAYVQGGEVPKHNITVTARQLPTPPNWEKLQEKMLPFKQLATRRPKMERLAELETDYAYKNYTVGTLKEHAYLLKELQMPYIEVVDETFLYARNTNYNDLFDFAFDFMLNAETDAIGYVLFHIEEYKKRIEGKKLNSRIKAAIRETVLQSAENRNAPLFERTVALIKIAKLNDEERFIFDMNALYYANINDWDNYTRITERYINKLKITDPSLLNDVAWMYHQYVADKRKLQNALEWAKLSVQIISDYENNYTLAAIFFKLGQTDSARPTAQQAIAIAQINKSDYARAERLLDKINANLSGDNRW